MKRRKSNEPSARDTLSVDFCQAFMEDFKQFGRAVIVEMREQEPCKYIEVAAKLIPQEPIPPDPYAGAQSQEDVARALLRQLNVPDQAMTPDMLDKAETANANFIETLERIAQGH